MSQGSLREQTRLVKEFVTAPNIAQLPQQIFSADRAECRKCRAHVRLGYRNARNAAAWCSVCCTTSVYDIAPRPVAA
jgi:hypothetical protein